MYVLIVVEIKYFAVLLEAFDDYFIHEKWFSSVCPADDFNYVTGVDGPIDRTFGLILSDSVITRLPSIDNWRELDLDGLENSVWLGDDGLNMLQ